MSVVGEITSSLPGLTRQSRATCSELVALDALKAGHDVGVVIAMRIYKEFFFEAAHFLPSAPAGHPNARVHGHSFRVRVTVDGEPDDKTGVVVHFDDFEAALADARDALDHRMLNEIGGLEAPTLERVAVWLWDRLHNRLPGLAEIEIARDSCHEGCLYRGPQLRLAAE
jgi:6-pyruvoyltetrahydropterin/6-carboxytetrahydropterin synthase